jgi:hypothetical protein
MKRLIAFFAAAALLSLSDTFPVEVAGAQHAMVGTGQTMRFVRAEVRDPGVNNIVAYTALVPAGWQVHGGVTWRLEFGPPAVADFSLYDPHGLAAVRFLPGILFNWFEGPTAGSIQPGQKAYGGIRMPPVMNNPQWYVQQVIVPQHFGYARNLTIGRIESMPAVAQQAAQQMAGPPGGLARSVHTESYRARLHYDWEGNAFDEDVYFTLFFTRSTSIAGVAWNWGPTSLHSIRAGRGALDELTPLLRVVAANVRPTPEWAGIAIQVQMSMHQRSMQTLRQLGDLQWQMYQDRQQLSRQHHDAWRQREASRERTNEAFSQYVRGVETYRTPDGERMELPSGYANAWMRPETGDVVVSNEHAFDPGRDFISIYR